jgi:hypothetical protein
MGRRVIPIEDGGGTVRKYLMAALFECGEDGETIFFCVSRGVLRFAVPISPEDAISIADDISAKARSIIEQNEGSV